MFVFAANILIIKLFSISYSLLSIVIISTIAGSIITGVVSLVQTFNIEERSFSYVKLPGRIWKKRIKDHNPKSAKSIKKFLWGHLACSLVSFFAFVFFAMRLIKLSPEDQVAYRPFLVAITFSETFAFQFIFRLVYLRKFVANVTCDVCQNILGWEILEVGKTHVEQSVTTEYGGSTDSYSWKKTIKINRSTPIKCKCAFCGNLKYFHIQKTETYDRGPEDGGSSTTNSSWYEG